jgi:hypothetical protein
VVAEPILHPEADAAVDAAMAADSPHAVLRHLDDPSGTWPGGAFPAGSGAAVLGPQSIDQFTLSAGPTGVVVFSRPWWPGWRAWDGTRELPLLRAAGVRLAVVVDDPAEVTFTYTPPLLHAGMLVGGLGWLSVGLLGWLAAPMRPRQGLGAEGVRGP